MHTYYMSWYNHVAFQSTGSAWKSCIVSVSCVWTMGSKRSWYPVLWFLILVFLLIVKSAVSAIFPLSTAACCCVCLLHYAALKPAVVMLSALRDCWDFLQECSAFLLFFFYYCCCFHACVWIDLRLHVLVIKRTSTLPGSGRSALYGARGTLC